MSTSDALLLNSSTASWTGVAVLSDDTSLMWMLFHAGAGANRLVPGDPMSPETDVHDCSASPAADSCHCDASFAPRAVAVIGMPDFLWVRGPLAAPVPWSL
ncbi:hypothetical protein [Leifsonia xyli]|uniref:hypothetical protein n=1 Tax=Leifsonia xyli TaxID=1575 RepID=UPI000A418453